MSKISNRNAKRKEKAKKQQIAAQIRLDSKYKIETYGRALTRRQFDAYCYCRMPLVRFTADEIAWYSLFENKILAVIIRDVTDNDYGFVILGRDARKLFRCISVSTDFHKTPKGAIKALAKEIHNSFADNIQDFYPQGDELKKHIDLFDEIIEENQQHEGYILLKNTKRFEAARNIISEIVNSFIDNDGHFKREFQSVNFQARLWELYLHMYFHNAGILIENNHAAPDFELNYFGEKVFVEAVTVNPSTNPNRPDLPAPETIEDIKFQLNDFMPIKFGSPLFSKLNKKYWDKEHVKDKPLILAIHDYHNENAMTWTRTALSDYLYGRRTRVIDGKPTIEIIEKHIFADKEIPSGFFLQQDTENISAVLFSNQATIPKFNRMGKLAGLGSLDIKMIRSGFLYNPDPNAFEPTYFCKDIDDPEYEETWADGLVMFHNPHAKHPINTEMFSDISHVFFAEDVGFYGYHQPYDVLGSLTTVITTSASDE